MTQSPLEDLLDQVRFTGYAERLRQDLDAYLRQDKRSFVVYLEDRMAQQPVTVCLYFNRPEGSDRYMFHRYDMSLRGSQQELLARHRFYLSQGYRILPREAYNLLCGRSVRKLLTDREPQPYYVWMQLQKHAGDPTLRMLKQYHPNYGYQLEDILERLPILELQEPEARSRLLEGLWSGECCEVRFLWIQRELRLFLEANPRFKTLTIYDDQMKRMDATRAFQDQQLLYLSPAREQRQNLPARRQEPKKPRLS